MSDRANILILGGGVIGTSIAWALASRGVDGIVVIDLDLAGVYASSELNAGAPGLRGGSRSISIAAVRRSIFF